VPLASNAQMVGQKMITTASFRDHKKKEGGEQTEKKKRSWLGTEGPTGSKGVTVHCIEFRTSPQGTIQLKKARND